MNTVAKSVLLDWQRGNIPFNTYPPDYEIKDKNDLVSNEELQVTEEALGKDLEEVNKKVVADNKKV